MLSFSNTQQPTATVPLLSEKLTPGTRVRLSKHAELLLVQALPTPELLDVTPVKAVAGLLSPHQDGMEWKRRPLVCLLTHPGSLDHEALRHHDP